MNPIDTDVLRDLLSRSDYRGLAAFCSESHPATAADALAELSPEEALNVFRHLEDQHRADIFSHMDLDLQVEFISLFERWEVARLLTDMPPDDRADLFKNLPEDRWEEILPAMAQAEREDIRRLMAYEEGTVGAVMTSDYAALSPDLTASEAIERLRAVAPDRETIYSAYVVDSNRRLLGYVSLKDLIVARRDRLVSDLMHTEIISARVGDDQEDAARKIQKYDLIALPVVDDTDSLVGIVTHDDALDIITQEHTEDMEKFMAIAGSHEASAYMKTGTFRHFRNRAGWVIILAVLGMVSGLIMQRAENLLLQFTMLVAFIPMLAAAGGNAGSQTASLIIRALALKEVDGRRLPGTLFKELRVAVLLGAVLGVLAFGRVVLFYGDNSLPEGVSIRRLGLAIATALSVQVVTSALIGAALPLLASRLRLDPAVMASPALTTIVDITGLVIYFGAISLMLGVR